jgi:ribonuclease III
VAGPSADDLVARAEARLGLQFRDKDLLRAALTHASLKTEEGRSNERLEFLGDAVLGLVVSEHLYARFPDFDEGRMSKTRAQVVSRRHLAELGAEVGLKDCILVGRMFAEPSKIADSVLSNAVEAVIAALYLDAGYEAARDFVLRRAAASIERAASSPEARDWKSLFSTWAQARGRATPTYVVLSTAGADHEKTFEVCASLEGRRFSPSYGRNKQEAEQRAARAALRELGEP